MPGADGRLSPAIEDYLKAVYVIDERGGGPVTTSSLADRLGVAPSSVSNMLRKLREHGLVEHPRYGDVALTRAGRRQALGVVRRHRLVELLLFSEFGYTWDEVHAEAEVLEHVVSDRLLDRIAERLGEPTLDPHGDPIPGRDGHVEGRDARRLSSLDAGATGELVRVDDDPAVLRHLAAQRVRLGDRIGLVRRDPLGGSSEVQVGRPPADRTLQLGPGLTGALWVRLT